MSGHDTDVSQSELSSEYRQLKSNFERLNNMFQEALDEGNRVKSELTAQLNEVTEKYTATLAENVALKEHVEQG